MISSRSIKLGVLLAILLMPFSLFADDQQKLALAEKYTIIAYPAEFYTLHAPFVRETLNAVNLDDLKLLQYEKNDLKSKLKRLLFGESIKAIIKARTEVYTENELIQLITFYESEIGKQIIDRIHQSKFSRTVLNKKELAAIKDFCKKNESICKKEGQFFISFGKKISEQADEIGYQIGLTVGDALHKTDYTSQMKSKPK